MSEYNRRMPFVKLFQVKLFNVLVRSGFNGLGDRSTLLSCLLLVASPDPTDTASEVLLPRRLHVSQLYSDLCRKPGHPG